MNSTYEPRFDARFLSQIQKANLLCKKIAPAFRFYSNWSSLLLTFDHFPCSTEWIRSDSKPREDFFDREDRVIEMSIFSLWDEEKVKEFILTESMTLLFVCNNSLKY